MEGSKSEAVFDSMNLNPQLFINETINQVDDLLDQAFDLYASNASDVLGSHYSKDGIDRVRIIVQSVLDKNLKTWEEYCLGYSFAVPQGFELPESDDDHSIQDDIELDAQLDSLRHKLYLEEKRSAELNSELQALQRSSVSNQHSVRLVNEALDLYKDSSVDEMFREMTKMVPELRAGMDRLKRIRMEAVESAKVERLKNPDKEFTATTSDQKREDFEKFMAELRKM